MPKMTPKRSHIDKILDLWDKWTAQKHTKTANINVKKLASLQHCVRAMTAAAIFEQLKQQISQNMILRRSTVTFLAMCCTSRPGSDFTWWNWLDLNGKWLKTDLKSTLCYKCDPTWLGPKATDLDQKQTDFNSISSLWQVFLTPPSKQAYMYSAIAL